MNSKQNQQKKKSVPVRHSLEQREEPVHPFSAVPSSPFLRLPLLAYSDSVGKKLPAHNKPAYRSPSYLTGPSVWACVSKCPCSPAPLLI